MKYFRKSYSNVFSLMLFIALTLQLQTSHAGNIIELDEGLAIVPDGFNYYLPSIVWKYLPEGIDRTFYEPPKNVPEHEIITNWNPYYLRVDLNGDGQHEYVITIRNLNSGKKGILVCGFNKHCKALFSGIPTSIKALDFEKGTVKSRSMDDLGWANMWRVYDQKDGFALFDRAKKYLTEADLPVGEVVNVSKLEGGGVYIYWNGSQIVVFAFPS